VYALVVTVLRTVFESLPALTASSRRKRPLPSVSGRTSTLVDVGSDATAISPTMRLWTDPPWTRTTVPVRERGFGVAFGAGGTRLASFNGAEDVALPARSLAETTSVPFATMKAAPTATGCAAPPSTE
jgi:hypothetical protein